MPKTIKISKKQLAAKPVVHNSVFSQVKWGESYTSLFLGIVVVVVAAVLVFSFLKGRNFYKTTSSQSTSVNQEQTGNVLPKTYLVKEGDDLWNIAEKIYGSGYNWVDVANENKLENPGVIYVGTKLTIPDVKPRIVKNTVAVVDSAQNSATITGSQYTIQKGDYLWSIAIRAYGDGYKWPLIAKANNLTNPDLIHSGNVLKLPR